MFSSESKGWWKSLVGFVKVPLVAGWKVKIARIARIPKVKRLINFARRLAKRVPTEDGELSSTISNFSDVGIAEYKEDMV